MENLKHTKGKWYACCKDKTPHFVFSKDGEVTICIPCKRQDTGIELSDEEFRANAKLIASAPDLLDALIEAKEQIEHLAWKLNKDGSDFAKVTTKEALKQIENTINKATK